MGQDCTRRTLLRALPVVGTGLLAGCSGVIGSITGPAPDLVVFNRTGNSITISITVRNRAARNSVLTDRSNIGSNNAAEYSDGLPSSGKLALQIETEGGLSGSYEWTVASEDQSMQVRVHENSIDFDTVSQG